jgi:hypothetical protein
MWYVKLLAPLVFLFFNSSFIKRLHFIPLNTPYMENNKYFLSFLV